MEKIRKKYVMGGDAYYAGWNKDAVVGVFKDFVSNTKETQAGGMSVSCSARGE